MVHYDVKINHLANVKNLEERVLEHWHILNPLLIEDSHSLCIPKWSAPPPQVLKFNVDAALRGEVATLAIVARDELGHVW